GLTRRELAREAAPQPHLRLATSARSRRREATATQSRLVFMKRAKQAPSARELSGVSSAYRISGTVCTLDNTRIPTPHCTARKTAKRSQNFAFPLRRRPVR